MSQTILTTDRLTLRLPDLTDAEFLLKLMNDPAWIRHIGDRNIRTLQQAKAYIEDTLIDLYRRHGFGMYVVVLTDSQIPVGLCGLVKREGLTNVDLGYALLPEFSGKGYALEAARATLEYGKKQLKVGPIVAITSEGNERSAKLPIKLGMKLDKKVRLSPEADEVLLFR